jgi:hypothetical protein
MRTNHWSLFIAALIFTENCCLEKKKSWQKAAEAIDKKPALPAAGTKGIVAAHVGHNRQTKGQCYAAVILCVLALEC